MLPKNSNNDFEYKRLKSWNLNKKKKDWFEPVSNLYDQEMDDSWSIPDF
jgi:hypothetical protein